MNFVVIAKVFSLNPLIIASMFNYAITKGDPSMRFDRFWWFTGMYDAIVLIMYVSWAPVFFLYLWIRIDEFALAQIFPSDFYS